MNNMIKKAGIVFLGFITILIIIEIILRIIGVSYETKSTEESKSGYQKQSDYTILSIGDSFTRGMGAPMGKDFSSQLEILLNQNSQKKYRVINGGLSGANSSQILKLLQSKIDAAKPDLMILLVGGANTWNFWGLDTTSTEGGASWFTDIIYRIRIFKLTKLFINNIKNKMENEEISNGKAFLEPEKFQETLNQFKSAIANNPKNGLAYYQMGAYYMRERKLDDAVKLFNEGIQADPREERNYVGLAACDQMVGNMNDAIKWINKGMEINPSNLNFHNQLCMFYNYLGDYEQQLKWAMIAIKMNPSIGNFYRFIQMLPPEFAQQKNAEIGEFLKQYPPSNNQRMLPFEHPCFYDYSMSEVSRNLDENDAKILKWVKSDLDKIIDMCKSQGIKVLIQNYPLRRKENFWVKNVAPVNKVLYEVSQTYNIPFVDNQRMFYSLGNQLDYYLEPLGGSEHCNDKGYALMAKDLYDEIIKQNFFTTNK
jgi:tetratricopeptide (TPR) repeat protein